MQTRKHIRLRSFDYSSANAYFITVCTHNFVHHFGKVVNGIMCLNEIGSKAYQRLMSISHERENVRLDELIVMPNHVHCLLEIKRKNSVNDYVNRFSSPISNSVSMMINQFKGDVKKWCNKNGYPHFEWQAKFYDHVVRNDRAYWAIKNYIINNPSSWTPP
jgi:putative transposase